MSGNNRRFNELRFVLFEEGEAWIAMCLERYIGAQGRSKEEAKDRLRIVYRAELDHTLEVTGEAFGGIEPAPERYHARYEASPVQLRGRIQDITADGARPGEPPENGKQTVLAQGEVGLHRLAA